MRSPCYLAGSACATILQGPLFSRGQSSEAEPRGQCGPRRSVGPRALDFSEIILCAGGSPQAYCAPRRQGAMMTAEKNRARNTACNDYSRSIVNATSPKPDFHLEEPRVLPRTRDN